MKVYIVIYEVGEYSDRTWSLHGVFSSKEKAEDYIRKETEPVLKTEEHVLLFEKEKEEFRKKFFENLSKLKDSLPLLISEAAKAKDPNYNKGKIKKTKEAIEFNENQAASINDHPLMKQSFQNWFDFRYRRPSPDDFSIIEEEVK